MPAPQLTTYVQGVTISSADRLNTMNQTCDNFAQLRALIGTAGMQVSARGQSSPNDGYQGDFYWNATLSGATDDNTSTIIPSGLTLGGWVRLTSSGNNTLVSTSVSSLTVASSGSLSGNVGTRLSFLPGQYVTWSNGANYIYGLITAYSATTGVMTFTATASGGSGTYTSWNVTNSPPPAIDNAALAAATNASSSASAVAVPWNFDTTTTMADPGTGNFRFNNATVASATAIAVSALSADSGNPNLRTWLATWGASSSATKATLTIKKKGAPATFAVFTMTAAATDNTTWLQFTVSYVTGSGTFSAADGLYVQWARVGDKGQSGAGTGNFNGPGSSVSGNLVSFGDTSGQLGADSGIAAAAVLQKTSALTTANIALLTSVQMAALSSQAIQGITTTSWSGIKSSSIPQAAIIGGVGTSSKLAQQVFTGNGTFTIPVGTTASTLFKVIVTGGGGSSGAGPVAGGGSGATAILYASGWTAGNTIAVTVGAAGGDSSIASGTQTITTVTGACGSGASSYTPGTGGTATNGTINLSGSRGGVAESTYGSFGSGGASAWGGGYGAGGSGGAGNAGIVVFEWVL